MENVRTTKEILKTICRLGFGCSGDE